MSQKRTITLAYGDGIGPEIMEATLRILEAAGAQLEYDVIEIGQKVYESGISSGIRPEAWDSLRRNKVFLKAPITTPQGGGFKSLNVTARKMLGLYANVRPVQTLNPIVPSNHNMDVVIVRENEEDLYAGIEHRQTMDVVQCLKLITYPGCERIIRYAFEYARANGRKKVTCFSKDNIMKLTDGLFHKMFDEMGAEYPEIEKDHKIIDIGSALLADSPEQFDVIVTLNLYGDIISDIAAQVAGSVGLCGSANIGQEVAMFEAIHGSAPDIAGKGIANPSGLLNGAIMMLTHINMPDVATKIHNAWLKTLEDGIHTGDVYTEGLSKQRVGTAAFADAVIERLGQKPSQLKPVDYAANGAKPMTLPLPVLKDYKAETVGADIFLSHRAKVNDLAAQVQSLTQPGLELKMMSNRGTAVWPGVGIDDIFLVDHWRLRFMGNGGGVVTTPQISAQMDALANAGLDVVKMETLRNFDGKPGYSLGQGQ